MFSKGLIGLLLMVLVCACATFPEDYYDIVEVSMFEDSTDHNGSALPEEYNSFNGSALPEEYNSFNGSALPEDYNSFNESVVPEDHITDKGAAFPINGFRGPPFVGLRLYPKAILPKVDSSSRPPQSESVTYNLTCCILPIEDSSLKKCIPTYDVSDVCPRAVKSNSSVLTVSEEAQRYLKGSLSTILIPSFYTLVFIISVPMNICALLVLARRIKPKNPATIYMLNLACADLLFTMVLPFKISYHFNGNDWIFGPAMCRLVTAAFYWNMYCSVLLITCISVDRLLAVVYPMESMAWRSKTNAIIACGAMWVLSFFGSFRLLLTEQTIYIEQLNITTCQDVTPEEPSVCSKMYFTILCCLLFILPLIITAVSYIRVILALNRVPLSVPGSSQKRRRAIVLAVIVLVMFVLCFTPTNLILLFHQLIWDPVLDDSQVNPDHFYVVYLVFLCLGSVNCLLDPLVYYFGSSHFHKELYVFLRCPKFTQSTSSSPTTALPNSSTSQTLQKSSSTDDSRINTHQHEV